jgi:hypothetical protein
LLAFRKERDWGMAGYPNKMGKLRKFGWLFAENHQIPMFLTTDGRFDGMIRHFAWMFRHQTCMQRNQT